MKRVIFAWLVLGCCGVVWAEGPPPPAPPASARPSGPPPQAPPALARPSGPPCQIPSGERLGHLLEAAEHLEAAGMPDEARRVRQQAAGEKQALLARIDALERELDRLRQLVRGSQILVHVKVVEVSRTKLRKLGFDFSTLERGPWEWGTGSPDGSRPLQLEIVDAGHPIFGLLEALRRDRLSRFLAEPTLVTFSGRPAYVHVGGEVPAAVHRPDGTLAVELREYGTRIDLVPTELTNGRIRLEVRARVSEIDPSRTVEVEGQECPALMGCEVDTGAEMNAGQTLILRGLVQDRRVESAAEPPQAEAIADKAATSTEEREEVELWVVVRPEICEPMAPRALGAQPAPPVPRALPPAVATEPCTSAGEKTK